ASSSATVTYTAGKADASTSIIRSMPDSIEVSAGEITSTLTVELRDANNNLVTTRVDKVEIFSTGSIGELSATDQGTYTATVYSDKTGTETFGFRLNDDPVAADDTATVRYTAGQYDLSKTTIEARPNTILADGKEISTIVVQLKDGFGNNLTTNAVGGINILGVNLAAQSNAKIPATYVANGRFELDLTSTTAGIEEEIRFETLANEQGTDFTTLTYLPGSVDMTQSVIYVDKTSIVADNVEEALITVELRDSQGNALKESQGNVKLIFNGVQGETGPFGIPTPMAGENIQDHNNGTYTATIKSQVANQTDSITFSLNEGDGEVISGAAAAQIRYIAGEIDLTQTIITASPMTIEADGIETSVITVQLRDAFGNDILTRASGDNVVLTRSTDIGDVENNGRLTYSSNGRYTTNVTSKVADSETFGYTINGVGTGQGDNSQVTLTYQTGGISLVRSELHITPETIVADGETVATVTVQLLDQEGNKPTENVGTVILTGIEKGQLTNGVGNGFELTHVSEGLYRGTIISTEAGLDTIGFTYNGDLAQAEKVLTYTAGAVDLTKSTIVINPSSITANNVERANVIVQLKDAFDNAITTKQGDVTLILEMGRVNNSDSKVLIHQANGTYIGTITSTVAGIEDVGFTVEGSATPATATASITYTAGRVNLSRSTLTVEPSEIVANDSDLSTITIQFKDGFGNNVTDAVEGLVELTGVDTGAIAVQPTVEAGDNGKYIATVKSSKAGFDDIGFRLGANEGANGQRERVTYIAGEADITKTRFTA
ncbi:invasin domain 3-containing protein, partial [Ignatzschineria sp. LJL83]